MEGFPDLIQPEVKDLLHGNLQRDFMELAGVAQIERGMIVNF